MSALLDLQLLPNSPSWLSQTKFEVESSASDKVAHVANNVAFGASIVGIYAVATGGSGLIAYASYLSMGFAIRKIASTLLGFFVYPAAKSSLDSAEVQKNVDIANLQITALEAENVIAKKVTICKSGIDYAGIILTNKDTLANGKWSIHALGNMMDMENSVDRLARRNFEFGCNTLLMNGPSVNESTGWPTRYQMGAGFEAGLQVLEQEMKASHIVMNGFSLGGGMMGEAILNHNFTDGLKQGTRYLFIADRTFSRLSKIAKYIAGQLAKKEIVGTIVQKVFNLTGTELDGIGAARKLSELNIPQIIVQHVSPENEGTDGVIPDQTSLAKALHKDDTLEYKIYFESSDISHLQPLPKTVNEDLSRHIQTFLDS
jgi:hypothetical protein